MLTNQLTSPNMELKTFDIMKYRASGYKVKCDSISKIQ